MKKSFTRKLASFVHDLQYENLEKAIVDKVKTCIYDAIACSCAGVTLPWSQAAIQLAQGQSEKAEATIWIDGSKSNSGYAAFANSVLNHSIIYEDMHAESGAHLGTIVIPAAFSLGEKLGSNGKQVIMAIIAGYESMGRLGKAMNTAEFSKRGFRPSGMFGPFGSAAVGAKLLNLNENQIVNAFGFAGNCGAGVNEWAYSGANDMYFHNGFAAINGLTAAHLAQCGAVASEWIVEGGAGLANAWAGGREKLPYGMEDLGKNYEIARVYHKSAAACAFTQETIQAALKAVNQHNIAPAEIDQIVVSSYPMAKIYPGCDYPGPFSSFLQAQMSNPFAVASVILHKDININYYFDYANPQIYDISRKVKVEIDPEAEVAYPREKRSKIKVVMKNGKVHTAAQTDLPSLTPQEILRKFKVLAAEKFEQKSIDELVSKINNIEQLENISELTSLLRSDKVTSPPQVQG